MNFTDQFTQYDQCAPPGVLLPNIDIEPRYYKELGLPQDTDNLTFLKRLCWVNMQKKGFSKKDTEYIERLKMEIDILDELGFIDYILLNWDILNFCKESGIPTGPGRGSAAGSLVLYFLGVTKVDPIKYGLFFERFVSRSRAKKIEGKDGKTYLDGSLLADVDNDIAYDRRSEVIDYIKNKFSGKTCKILNLVTLSSKLCIKEVGKLVGLQNEEEMNLISDQIPVLFGRPSKISEAIEENEKFATWIAKFPEVESIARKLEGLIKNTGVHASGIAISHHQLTDICPIQKTKEGDLVSCYDMHWIAELTVKFDILGLKTLTILNDTKALLADRGVEINFEDIDLNSKEIYLNLANLRHKGGQGLFQIEADTNFEVCCTVKPRSLEEISAVVAIARPGALNFKDKYADYVRTGDSELEHEYFKDILDYTGGIPLYQEQLMKMANKIGFTLDESEQLRRIVGKKKVDQMPAWKQKIAEKIEENKLDKQIGDILWKVAQDSANYSFNKSHSISYAVLAAWTAFMKFNYPQEFFVALLKMAKNEADPFDQIAKICAELQSDEYNNMKLLPPDLIESKEDFCVEGNNIRYGLNAIKGVSEKSLDGIMAYNQAMKAAGCSETKSKCEVFDVAKKVKINIGLLSALIQAGTLDSLKGNNSRARLVLEAQSYNLFTDREKRNAKLLTAERGNDILKLIIDAQKIDLPTDDNKPFMKKSRWDTFFSKYESYRSIYDQNKNNNNDGFADWYYEKELLGYSYSQTLQSVLKREDARNISTIRDLIELDNNKFVKLIGTVKGINKRSSRQGNSYYFIVIGDDTGEVKTMFMQTEYEPYLGKGNSLPEKGSIVILAGRKSDSTVFVNDMKLLDNKVYMKLSDLK